MCKKILSAILVLMLILSVFAACSKEQKEPEQSTPSNSTGDVAKPDDKPSEPEVTEKAEKKYTLQEGEKLETKYITEKYSYSGKFRWYDDETQTIEDYVLRLPQLKSSSDSAKALNKKICDEYEEIIEKSIETFELECVVYDKISWESYLYNDIISIVITRRDYMSESYRDYSVYNFNVKTEKEVTNSEILKLTGLTESEFIKKAKSAAEKEFKRTQSYNPGIDDFYKECLGKTVSDKNITSSLPMFIDDNGVLNTIVVLYQVGGGETNNIILEVK